MNNHDLDTPKNELFCRPTVGVYNPKAVMIGRELLALFEDEATASIFCQVLTAQIERVFEEAVNF